MTDISQSLPHVVTGKTAGMKKLRRCNCNMYVLIGRRCGDVFTAALLILASVRVAEPVKELISQQLHHADVALRTSAVLRFSVLWRFRYQVWPRLEYGAHIHFKVVSSSSSSSLCTTVAPLSSVGAAGCRGERCEKALDSTVTTRQSVGFVGCGLECHLCRVAGNTV